MYRFASPGHPKLEVSGAENLRLQPDAAVLAALIVAEAVANDRCTSLVRGSGLQIRVVRIWIAAMHSIERSHDRRDGQSVEKDR